VIRTASGGCSLSASRCWWRGEHRGARAGPLAAPAGAEVTVVERAPELRPGGQAVDARGVAKEVIRRMGLDAAVRAARTETAARYTVDVDGNVLETFRADDDGGDGYIARSRSCAGTCPRCSTTIPATVSSTSSATDRRAHPGRGRGRRGLRGRRSAALRPGGRADGLHSRCGRWSSGRTNSSSATSGWCWPSTRAQRVRGGPLA